MNTRSIHSSLSYVYMKAWSWKNLQTFTVADITWHAIIDVHDPNKSLLYPLSRAICKRIFIMSLVFFCIHKIDADNHRWKWTFCKVSMRKYFIKSSFPVASVTESSNSFSLILPSLELVEQMFSMGAICNSLWAGDNVDTIDLICAMTLFISCNGPIEMALSSIKATPTPKTGKAWDLLASQFFSDMHCISWTNCRAILPQTSIVS